MKLIELKITTNMKRDLIHKYNVWMRFDNDHGAQLHMKPNGDHYIYIDANKDQPCAGLIEGMSVGYDPETEAFALKLAKQIKLPEIF